MTCPVIRSGAGPGSPRPWIPSCSPVDAYLTAHPSLDRSAVIDEALRLWRARELERALAAQFAAPDEIPPAERRAWDHMRRSTTARQFTAANPDA